MMCIYTVVIALSLSTSTLRRVCPLNRKCPAKMGQISGYNAAASLFRVNQVAYLLDRYSGYILVIDFELALSV